MKYKIITQKVLNESTGELESQDYKHFGSKAYVKGGFRMSYKSYDEIQIKLLKSSKDIEIFLYIRDKFTYARVETSLPAREISIQLGTSQPKVSRLIKELVENDFLKRATRGIYRMNPYMFIPYKSNGLQLQKEWSNVGSTNPVDNNTVA